MCKVTVLAYRTAMSKRAKHITSNKDLRRLLCAIEEQGFTIEIRRAGHLKVTAPTGQVFFTGSSPSDKRAILNFRSQLRKAGAQV